MRTHLIAVSAVLFFGFVASAAPLPHKADSVALVWSSGQYRYDAAGNVIAIGTNAYRYDPVGRLIDGTAHTPSYTNRQTFRYDAYGNLERIETTMQRAGATGIAAEVDQLAVNPASNRITDLTRCQAGVNCISGDYDAAGNQIASAAGGTFDYDALGMMTRLRAGLKNEQYVYDADNERIATVAPGQTRYTLRDLGGKVVREATYSASTWSWQKDYVYRDGSLLAAITPTQREHFHLDHLGSPRLITDDAGFKLAAHTYWPFGAEAPGSDADTERMKFTGHERDFGTGPGLDLDYMHARFYGVVGGRFMTVDPVLQLEAGLSSPQRWNRYSYVANNPVHSVDPTGAVLVSLTGKDTILQIAGDAASRVCVASDGTVNTSQLTADDLVNNEGALLLYEMVGSKNVYTYEEGSTARSAGGRVDVSGVLNLDDNPADAVGASGKPVAKPPTRFPPADVNGAVTVDPSVHWFDAATGSLQIPNHAIAFHELAESYAKVEKNIRVGNHDGPGAHYEARQREDYLMLQRPSWTPFPAGGVLRR